MHCECQCSLQEGCPAVLAIVNLPCKGLGVLAVDQIERGTYITAYAGEVKIFVMPIGGLSTNDKIK